MEVGFADSTNHKKVTVKSYGEDTVCVDARVVTDVKDTMRGGTGNYRIQFREGFLPHPGSYIIFDNEFGNPENWLLTSISEDPIFPKHLIKRCNYLLKWKNTKSEIVERWVAFDDSYKLYSGILNNNKYTTVLPYSTQTLLIPYDPETINIRRDMRFLIDDADVEGVPDAYIVTNRNVVTKSFNKHGVIGLALSQHQFNHETDNRELMVADYYSAESPSDDTTQEAELACKISYSGNPELKMTNRFKTFTGKVVDSNGNIKESTFEWKISILPELEQYFQYSSDSTQFKIKAEFSSAISGATFTLKCRSIEYDLSDEISVKVVSII